MTKRTKGLIIVSIVIVSTMGVFKFFGKQDGKEEQRFPDENFSIFQASDSDGGLIFITANMGYTDYKFKGDYPWFLSIQIETRDMNENGHPTDEEAGPLNQIEDLIDGELGKVCTRHFIWQGNNEGTEGINVLCG